MALPSKTKGKIQTGGEIPAKPPITIAEATNDPRPFMKRPDNFLDFSNAPTNDNLKSKVNMEISNPDKPEPFNPNSVPSNFLQRDKLSELNLLRQQVFEIITLIDIGDMPADILNILINALEPHREIDFDEEFNVRDELVTQMKLVRSIRISLLKPGGALKEDTTVTEVKSVLDASMRLSDMLNKVNKDLVNQERIRAVEAAFMDVIGEMPKEVQIAYVESLEKRMKAQKALEKK